MNLYEIYDRESGVLLARGTARECQKQLGCASIDSFYALANRSARGINKQYRTVITKGGNTDYPVLGKEHPTQKEIEEKKYGLHSPFDPDQHAKEFVHYLEVVIGTDGTIMYAVPSHQEKLIALACEKLEVTRDELNGMCPREYYGDFITWLAMVSGACSVWENFVIAPNPTNEQLSSLKMLAQKGLYLGEIPGGRKEI